MRKCKNCMFHVVGELSPMKGTQHECRRYPKAKKVRADHWCGEWKQYRAEGAEVADTVPEWLRHKAYYDHLAKLKKDGAYMTKEQESDLAKYRRKP